MPADPGASDRECFASCALGRMTTRVLSVTCCERNSLELCADGVTVRTSTTERDGSAQGTTPPALPVR